MLPFHAKSELISSERLAKAHLGIPKEMGGKAFVRLIISKRLEIFSSLLHSFLLLWPHLEILRALKHSCLVVLNSLYGLLHLSYSTSEPLTLRILYMSISQHFMYCLV